MNSKITNSHQQLNLKKKTMKTKTKQTPRPGPESEKWTSHGGFSAGKGRGRIREEKVQRISSIIDEHKIGRD